MIVYGTKIKSDIDFPLDLSHETETRYEVELSSKVPIELKKEITCGFPLYWAHGRMVYLYSDREFERSKSGQPWSYEVEDVVRFYWQSEERTIYYEFGEKGDKNLLSFWFIHLFLPFYLALEDLYHFLHAGAVEVDGKPIFFIAPSMGGKSTMTDYFIKKGHTLISDDKVPTFIQNSKFMAVGSHPYHRPYRKFEELGYKVEKFSSGFRPIHAFYKLESVDANANTGIEEIKGYAKLDVLLPNYLFMFSWIKPEVLTYLSNMLNDVRVFSVQVPWDMDRLDEVYIVIAQHSKGIL